MLLSGILVTITWLLGLVVFFYFRFQELLILSPNEWGDFVAGVTAPLAFMWLVIGYFQQGRELVLNREALILQAQELKNSVQQQEQLVQVTREEIEVTKAELARKAAIEKRLAQPVPVMVSANRISSIDGYYVTTKLVNYGASIQRVLFTVVTLRHYIKWDFNSGDDAHDKWDTNESIYVSVFVSGKLESSIDIIGVEMSFIDGLGEKMTVDLSLLLSNEGRVSFACNRFSR